MEEFLPGLLKAMEERLGRFGRPLTTFVVICLAFGAAAWGIKLFIDNAISPLTKFILAIFEVQPITLDELVRKLITPFSILIIVLVILYLLFRFVVRKTIMQPSKQQVNEATQIIGEIKKEQQKLEQKYNEAKLLLESDKVKLILESTSDKEASQPE